MVPTGIWEAVPQRSVFHSFLRQRTARCNRSGKQRGRGMRDRDEREREVESKREITNRMLRKNLFFFFFEKASLGIRFLNTRAERLIP